jgi:putative ABC transport system substrate-binding protein
LPADRGIRRAADCAGKILREASPTTFRSSSRPSSILPMNLATAKALGLTVPPMVLAIADEVIE